MGLYFLNNWASKKMGNQQELIEKSKQTMSIYVIDKKKTKAEGSGLPKAVMEKLPKIYKFMKVYLVKAKIGPQIMTLMCEKKVFNALPVKKNIKVEIAGIYIIGMKGMKSEKEMKEASKAKKQASNESKKPWYKFFSKG